MSRPSHPFAYKQSYQLEQGKHRKAVHDYTSLRNMAAPSGTCPTFPAPFGITSQVFQAAFDDLRDGTYRLKPDGYWPLLMQF